jgi:hypothetical protein
MPKDAQAVDGLVEGTAGRLDAWVVGDCSQVGDDGDVHRMGAFSRIILFVEGSKEISEKGMVVFGSWCRESGIVLEAQKGDPLSDRVEGRCHCCFRSDRFAGLPGAAGPAAPSKHKEVAQSDFLGGEVLQVGVCAVSGTVGFPFTPDGIMLFVGLGDVCHIGFFECSAASSLEFITGSRVSVHHGVSCGYACCM